MKSAESNVLLRLIFLSLIFLSHAFTSRDSQPFSLPLPRTGRIRQPLALSTGLSVTIGSFGRTVRFVTIRTSLTF